MSTFHKILNDYKIFKHYVYVILSQICFKFFFFKVNRHKFSHKKMIINKNENDFKFKENKNDHKSKT